VENRSPKRQDFGAFRPGADECCEHSHDALRVSYFPNRFRHGAATSGLDTPSFDRTVRTSSSTFSLGSRKGVRSDSPFDRRNPLPRAGRRCTNPAFVPPSLSFRTAMMRTTLLALDETDPDTIPFSHSNNSRQKSDQLDAPPAHWCGLVSVSLCACLVQFSLRPTSIRSPTTTKTLALHSDQSPRASRCAREWSRA